MAELRHAFLLVDAAELLRQGCGRGTGFQANPHKADFVDMYVDREQTVLYFIEGGEDLQAWCFCEIAL